MPAIRTLHEYSPVRQTLAPVCHYKGWLVGGGNGIPCASLSRRCVNAAGDHLLWKGRVLGYELSPAGQHLVSCYKINELKKRGGLIQWQKLVSKQRSVRSLCLV